MAVKRTSGLANGVRNKMVAALFSLAFAGSATLSGSLGRSSRLYRRHPFFSATVPVDKCADAEERAAHGQNRTELAQRLSNLLSSPVVPFSWPVWLNELCPKVVEHFKLFPLFPRFDETIPVSTTLYAAHANSSFHDSVRSARGVLRPNRKHGCISRGRSTVSVRRLPSWRHRSWGYNSVGR